MIDGVKFILPPTHPPSLQPMRIGIRQIFHLFQQILIQQSHMKFLIKAALKNKLGTDVHSVARARTAINGWLDEPITVKIQFDWKNDKIIIIDPEFLEIYNINEYLGNAKMEERGIINDMWRINISNQDPNGWEYLIINFASDGYTWICLLYTSPSPRDLSTSRMPSSA
eukprot:TRINITY_DN50758_c0_g1_i1.p2 TRINITY_DN50758_c0_g1~~TRINITY_DN50758_c0_g1_i1.p2  ORF type:complete len:169 (+),score=8.18 TRINITY_DN50758_c0_g1_i1:289-795(+)